MIDALTAQRIEAFQSTLPARGATAQAYYDSLDAAISIHAPRTGSDTLRCNKSADHRISIHAPRTGSDLGARRHGCRPHNFNPRSPHGERHGLQFFRSPGKYFNPRSPHGERPKAAGDAIRAVTFQSTLPARGATLRIRFMCLEGGISIHAPRTGSDNARAIFLSCFSRISIHAPRTGSDSCTVGITGIVHSFQSTLPARGATQWVVRCGACRRFQSTLPARGATGLSRRPRVRASDFNPRSPHGERPRLSRASLFFFVDFNPRSPHGERRRRFKQRFE